jgi:hypothetical protein
MASSPTSRAGRGKSRSPGAAHAQKLQGKKERSRGRHASARPARGEARPASPDATPPQGDPLADALELDVIERPHDAGESAELAGGDVDAFAGVTESGEEAVGGSTPTPDQDEVDEIGEALGVIYTEGEPLHTTDKIAKRDVDRWELDPASAEDFAERRDFAHAAPQRRRPRKAK